MTLKHLKIFVAVCEYGSTTKAAEALYIVQPTISHSIVELENYYKVVLFHRVNQRLVLTEVGKELLVKAKEILAGFEDFESLATSRGQSPKVKIGASLTLGQTLIPLLLQRIEKEGLQLQPQILIRQSTRLENELEQGNLDFAVISGEVLSPHLTAVPISRGRFVAVANASYAVPASLTLRELTEYPLLLREHGSSSRDFLERVAVERGLQLSPVVDSSNNQALVTALFSSIGVGFLPDSYVAEYLLSGQFKEVVITDLTANQTNYLVFHKNKKMNASQKQAFELIKEL